MNINLELQELEYITDCLPIGVMVFDDKLQLKLWNDSALNLTGVGIEDVVASTSYEVLEKNVHEIMGGTIRSGLSSQQHGLIERDGKTISYTVKRISRDGHAYTVLLLEDATRFFDADKIKRDFIVTLLHKLRGPLSTLKTSFAIIKAGALDGVSDYGRELLDMGNQEIDHLSTLIGDMRDLFYIETGFAEKDTDIALLPVMPILDGAVEELSNMSESINQISHRVVKKGALNAIVKADYEMLKKVFFILLKNALMYSPETTQVVFECIEGDGFIDIKVRDEGIGLKEQSMPQLFSKYFREDNEMTRIHEGNGLGLFIAKSFIELMTGTIYCESLEGKGCVFSLSVPCGGDIKNG